jgi:hypothetical protein
LNLEILAFSAEHGNYLNLTTSGILKNLLAKLAKTQESFENLRKE